MFAERIQTLNAQVYQPMQLFNGTLEFRSVLVFFIGRLAMMSTMYLLMEVILCSIRMCTQNYFYKHIMRRVHNLIQSIPIFLVE